MSRARDRIVAAIAGAVLVASSTVVVWLVLDAQHSGIETREQLRLEQVRSEASRMETRIQQAYSSLGTVYGAPGAFTLLPRDEADAARITPQNPDATSGIVLVDARGTIVNGSLLRDPAVVGQDLVRDGLEVALAGTPTILPVADGLTTSRPTIAVATPTRDEQGSVSGAAVFEVEVAPGSSFNEEIAELATGRTGGFLFLDQNGVVVAANDESRLARPLDLEVTEGLLPGFHRDGGYVAAVAPVPAAGWTAVFLQEADEFEGDLTGPLQLALLLFLGVVAIVGVFTVVALLRRLQAAREEQRRLQEIGEAREEFTSIVSHELRTPVAGLMGFLQTTIDHWDSMGEADRRRAVGRAFSNARALQTLTSDVLDSAAIEARTLTYRFETVDLRSCIAEATATLIDAAPERPVNVSTPVEPVAVRADALRIRQVLNNLLDNAAKSSAPDAPIDVELSTADGTATVTVRDRGPGIAVGEQDRIFGKFTRGRAGISRGTGLGLYISQHIVEAHRGTITAESAGGEPGARLTFTLPLSSDEPD
ncbi:MAG TPA: sensor histidine kinase [Acidimicrobiales bacterium]|nr:sensor histidine kinase [Acidimicrobiales bacterium]